MEALQSHKQSFRIRKIDIMTWESDVARQHDIRSLPTLLMYDGKTLVSSDTREIVKMLNGL